MPKYTFECQACQKRKQIYATSSVAYLPCEEEGCTGVATRQMPVINGNATVKETVDKYTGTVRQKDQDQMIKERQDQYYWTVEVPRLVASGTYSVETMLENGWIWVDDKNQIHTNTKPPHKR